VLIMRRRLGAALAVALTVSVGVQGCSPRSSDTKASTSTTATVGSSGATAVNSTPASPEPSAPPGAADWEVIGTSVQGKPIRAQTIGQGPRKVLFIGGIHGDEAEGAVATAELPAAFEAAGLAEAVTLTIIEDANPDGRAARTRGNANGVDVNRNFPAANFDSTDPSNGGTPLSQPESRAVKDTIDRIQPSLVLVAHSWAGRHFINFDGPAREIAERFSASSGLPVEASSSFAPTPGSLGSYFGRDRGIAILTIEVLKGSDPTAVWGQIREALLQAIAG
jgi:murein peptide amidase A